MTSLHEVNTSKTMIKPICIHLKLKLICYWDAHREEENCALHKAGTVRGETPQITVIMFEKEKTLTKRYKYAAMRHLLRLSGRD